MGRAPGPLAGCGSASPRWGAGLARARAGGGLGLDEVGLVLLLEERRPARAADPLVETPRWPLPPWRRGGGRRGSPRRRSAWSPSAGPRSSPGRHDADAAAAGDGTPRLVAAATRARSNVDRGRRRRGRLAAVGRALVTDDPAAVARRFDRGALGAAPSSSGWASGCST